jgi:hypothetical protein
VDAGAREAGAGKDRVYSTGFIVVVSAAVFLVVFLIPALLWTAAILFGQ